MSEEIKNTVNRTEKSANAAKIIIAVALALLIAAAAFTAGFFAGNCAVSDDARSLDWLLKTIEENYYFYDDFDADGAGEDSLKSIADKLDIYSEYYTAEEYAAEQNDNRGRKSGVGISYGYLSGVSGVCDDGGIFLYSVVGNSPAYRAGLVAGDVLVSGTYGGTTTQFTDKAAFAEFMEKVGDNESFTLSTKESDFTVARQEYKASYTFMATCESAWEFVGTAYGGLTLGENLAKKKDLPEDTAYVSLSQFYGTAAEELGILFDKFEETGKSKLILDLRNNGGGYVSVMQSISGYFTAGIDGARSAGYAEYKNGRRQVFDIKKQGRGLISADTDVYVLTNSGTASASEALIGVLVSYGVLDYKNIFVSDFSKEYLDMQGDGAKTGRTYGKGIMQSTFVNDWTGEAVKLTTAKIFWPNGKCIHGSGLSAADGCTVVPAKWSVTKDDAELREVLKIIESR